MMIKLTNQTNGLSVQFWEKSDFTLSFGYQNTLPIFYTNFVNENKIFICSNLVGFRDNPKVTPTVTNGQQENGVNFKANRFNSRFISWNFDNVFQRTSKVQPKVSPNNYLQTLILIDNDTLLVEVFVGGASNDYFFQEFHVTENTTLEGGAIQLESSNGSNGVYWRTGGMVSTNYWFNLASNSEVGEPMVTGWANTQITKKLNRKFYPFYLDFIALAQTTPVYRVGGSKDTGHWIKIELMNTLTDESLVLENLYDDEYLIYNSFTKQCVNENNINRNDCKSGDDLVFVSGQNSIRWIHDPTVYIEDLITASEYLPLDFNLEVTYDEYVSAIEEEVEGC